MRFRILDLLLATAFCGFTCAGLIKADPLFECLAFSLALLSVLVASLLAIAQSGSKRVYWVGFLVAGGGYLAFAHLGDSRYVLGEPRMYGPELTTRLLRLAYSTLHPGDPADVPPP